MGYSLRVNHKQISTSSSPHRNLQFEYLTELRGRFQRRHLPIIPSATPARARFSFWPIPAAATAIAAMPGRPSSSLNWPTLSPCLSPWPTIHPALPNGNLIEHRLFSEVSRNWAGEPLDSYQKILNYARTTKTQTGLTVTYLDRRNYPCGLKPTPDQLASLRL
jgi:Rhodopirellula transposase DDE domain